jgi:NAD(P)-dependent dehydrogenase (short-subunit alcohol dehydrogenase family)
VIHFTDHDLFLVTGASSGIGRATTLQLNAEGARVIAVARDEKKLQDLANSAENPGNVYLIAMDLIQEKHNLKFIFSKLVKEYGKLRGMLHAAGINKLMPIKSISVNDYDSIQEINSTLAFLLMQAFSDRRHCESPASIVLLSSISAHLGYSGLAAYSAAKGALEAMTRSFAIELASKSIRVNAIASGHVDTPMSQKMLADSIGDYMQQELKRYPLGIGTTKNVADLAVFLLSDRSAWLTGQCIILDGGRSLV